MRAVDWVRDRWDPWTLIRCAAVAAWVAVAAVLASNTTVVSWFVSVTNLGIVRAAAIGVGVFLVARFALLLVGDFLDGDR